MKGNPQERHEPTADEIVRAWWRLVGLDPNELRPTEGSDDE